MLTIYRCCERAIEVMEFWFHQLGKKAMPSTLFETPMRFKSQHSYICILGYAIILFDSSWLELILFL